MNWKNTTIGKKIFWGFGLLLILLAIFGPAVIHGSRGHCPKTPPESSIPTNWTAKLVQMELDLLIWGNKVSAFPER